MSLESFSDLLKSSVYQWDKKNKNKKKTRKDKKKIEKGKKKKKKGKRKGRMLTTSTDERLRSGWIAIGSG